MTCTNFHSDTAAAYSLASPSQLLPSREDMLSLSLRLPRGVRIVGRPLYIHSMLHKKAGIGIGSISLDDTVTLL